MTKNIAIVGTAISSNMLAPFNEPDWEVWGCSMANAEMLPESVQTWFEIHHLDLIAGGGPRTKAFIDFLARKQRVWLSRLDPRIPQGQVLDAQSLVDKFGPYVFTSTVAWMLAYAITLKPQAIGIYGVDMAAKSEWADQRPACQHFMRIATLSGIKIMVPIESDLLEPPPLYGFAMHDPMFRKLNIQQDELKARLTAAQAAHEQKALEVQFLKGAIEQNEKDVYTYAGNQRQQGAQLHGGTGLPALRQGIQSPAPTPATLPGEEQAVSTNGDDPVHDAVALAGANGAARGARKTRGRPKSNIRRPVA